MSESPSTAHPAIQIRRFRLLLTYCLLCLPLIVFGARAALRVNANSRLTWVSEDFPARRDFDAFRKTFGSGDVVVMGWEGCTIDDGRLTKLTKLLRHSKTFTQRDGSACFERVISGGEAYSALIQPPVDLSEEEAARRLRGTLLGPDGNSTCLVIAFTPEALVDRARLVRLIRLAANRHCSIPANDLHLAGPVLDGLEVDRASQASLDGFAIPSAIAVLALCFVFLRDWRAALLVFGLSVFCEGATLALVHYCGDSMSALLIVLPPLIQTAAVSGGIHLVNYYFDAATDGAVGAQAASRAIRLAWLPVALSAGTTAIGLGSLMVSDLAPIRSFGAYGTVGMLLTTGLLLTVIPGVFALFPELLKRRVNLVPRAEVSWSNAGWMQLSRFLARWHGVVAFGACAAIVGLGLGAGGLNTSVRIETLFDQNSSLLKDYAWLEHKIGPLVPIEIVMRCDARCQLTQLDRLRLVDDIEREAARLTGVGGTMSAATFAPDLQPPEGVSDEAFAQIAGRSLEEGRPKLIEVNYLHESGPVQEWRITARVSALAKLDYGQFLDVVHERIQPLVADEGNEPLRGVSLRSTGIMPVVHAIQRQLFSDLFSSFVSALVVVTLVMVVVQAGVVAGLISMVSNIFPIALVFGWLGWRGATVDIGSVMTASVALGIAIDNTLHLLTFFRREVDGGSTPRVALESAYRHCGNAMAQSTLVCLAGTTVFALAEFVPTQRFAILMLALLLLALIGDLVVLPALLLGPLGRFFHSPVELPTSESAGLPGTEIAAGTLVIPLDEARLDLPEERRVA